jgi:hypothetical protein
MYDCTSRNVQAQIQVAARCATNAHCHCCVSFTVRR